MYVMYAYVCHVVYQIIRYYSAKFSLERLTRVLPAAVVQIYFAFCVSVRIVIVLYCTSVSFDILLKENYLTWYQVLV